ncbi:MAG TPA: hypothetical protein VET89_00105 [Stellaceae bacterium]|nr:hypothetical protein [Stellaceae bacterium]
MSATAAAQQPVPLLPPSPDELGSPSPGEGQQLPLTPPPADQAAPSQAPAASPSPGRVFCDQNVTFQVAHPASVPENYRQFLGIWSDAAWTPQLCAALIVESVTEDGTATVTYAFGPIGPVSRTPGGRIPGNRNPGGVLRGTGIIRDGELRFQNNDGTQYAFKPFYADLAGRLTAPEGQTYEAVFKRTY